MCKGQGRNGTLSAARYARHLSPRDSPTRRNALGNGGEYDCGRLVAVTTGRVGDSLGNGRGLPGVPAEADKGHRAPG